MLLYAILNDGEENLDTKQNPTIQGKDREKGSRGVQETLKGYRGYVEDPDRADDLRSKEKQEWERAVEGKVATGQEEMEQLEKYSQEEDLWKDSLNESEDPWQLSEYENVQESWKMKNLPDCSADASPWCPSWAAKGQCVSTPVSMLRMCGKSCCEKMKDPETKKLIDAAKANAGLSVWSDLQSSSASRRVFPEGYMVSWKPRIMIFPNFLSDEECDHLIELASAQLKPSRVVTKKEDGTTTASPSTARTSSGFFLSDAYAYDPVVRAIDRRMETVSHIEHTHAEALHVLRYKIGEKYLAHNDYLQQAAIENDPRGQRVATLLMYLSDVEQGGETNFPRAVPLHDLHPTVLDATGLMETPVCGDSTSTGVSVRPKRGTAVLFWDRKPDGSSDPASMHASCPVLEGEKWSGTHWIRERSGHKTAHTPP